MKITHNLNWNGPFRCYADLDINSSGRLTMQGQVQMPPNVIIETGGTLVLSGNIRFENGHKLVLSTGAYVCAASNLAVQGSVSKPFYTEEEASSTIISGIAPEIKPLYVPSCSPQGRLFFLRNCTKIPDMLYVQKEQINQDITYVGKTIIVGNSVDPNSSRPKGDVVVNTPARATFVYKNRLVLDKGFRCNSGGSYRGLRF